MLAAQQTDEIRTGAHVYTPPALRLTTQAQLVQVEAVVRDGNGRPVAGLTRNDFEILDEGKPRAIAAFSVETRLPITALAPASRPSGGASPAAASAPSARSVLLLFDDLHATTGELRRAQNAAQYFVKNSLGSARAAIFASSDGLALDFTSDAVKLASAIEGLHSHLRVPESGLMPCPRISPYQAYLIANNIDPSAMIAAVSEAAACTSSDSSVRNPYEKSGARAGTLSKLPTDPLSMAVQQQAQQTWDQARAASLDSYDALSAAIGRLASAPGARVLLLVSEGFLSGPEETPRQQTMIDSAIRAGVVINSLDAKGLWPERPARPFNEGSQTLSIPPQTFQFEASTIGARNATLNASMGELASATGGLFFHNSNDLAGGFDELGAAPEVAYLLAFRPNPDEAPGRYHKLKVRMASGKHDYVQTRPGYFAPANAASSESGPRRMDREVTGREALSEIPMTLAGRLGKTEKGGPQISIVIHLDLTKIQFAEREGRFLQRLRFIGALIDTHGEMAAAKEGEMDFALREETLARLMASGVNATLTLSAPPGAYRVRVVAEEANGRMAAATQTVKLPE
jgi:VWFA-related protein